MFSAGQVDCPGAEADPSLITKEVFKSHIRFRWVNWKTAGAPRASEWVKAALPGRGTEQRRRKSNSDEWRRPLFRDQPFHEKLDLDG